MVFQGLFPHWINFISANVLGELINFTQTRQLGLLGVAVIVFILTTILANVVGNLESFLTQKYYRYTQRLFVMRLLAKQATLDIQHYQDPEMRDKLNQLEDGASWRPANLISEVLTLGTYSVKFISASLICISLSPVVFIVLLTFFLPTIWINLGHAERAWGIWEADTKNRRLFWDITGYMSKEASLMELRIFNTGKYLFQRVTEIYNNFYNREAKAADRRQLGDMAANALGAVGVCVFWGHALILAANGVISVENFIFYSAVASSIGGDIGSYFRHFIYAYDNGTHWAAFFDVEKAKPYIISGKTSLKGNSTPEIELKNVNFKYPGSDQSILENVNLKIEPGQHIAFVGENGAGKSTIIKLISRFYDPTSGEILVNGKNLREYVTEDWHNHLGVLFQDFSKFEFFPAGVGIALGNYENMGNLEKVKESAQHSGADKFIETFPNKYDQILSKQYEGGTDLSGGQWQRMALARAFFRDAPILILDEPTSAIDAQGEAEIFERLNQFTQGKTVIMISHRFSTVRKADKIYVIDEGKIVEQGSHEELMRLNGKYANAFRLQAEAYNN